MVEGEVEEVLVDGALIRALAAALDMVAIRAEGMALPFVFCMLFPIACYDQVLTALAISRPQENGSTAPPSKPAQEQTAATADAQPQQQAAQQQAAKPASGTLQR